MKIKTLYTWGKSISLSPFIFPIFIVYLIKKKSRKLINEDLKTIVKFNTGSEIKSYKKEFWFHYTHIKEFRSQVHYRLKPWSLFLKILPGQTALTINVPNIGGGFYVHHGHSTRISASHIGSNFTIHHNCSVVHGKGGAPYIGNNVFIGTGATIMGKIIIGDNVKIGANTVVLKNVPNNCTVVGNKTYIVKKDGIRIKKEL